VAQGWSHLGRWPPADDHLVGNRPEPVDPLGLRREIEEEGPSSEAKTLCCVHFAKVLETKDLHIGAYVNCGKFCVHSA
jgi:hypothetical protein